MTLLFRSLNGTISCIGQSYSHVENRLVVLTPLPQGPPLPRDRTPGHQRLSSGSTAPLLHLVNVVEQEPPLAETLF